MVALVRNALSFRPPPAIRQSAIYGLAVAFPKGISLLMVPVFTAFLVPAEYGQLDILQTLANLLTIVVAMGMAEMLFRFAGESQNPSDANTVASDIAGLAVTSSIVAIVITQLLAPYIANWLPGDVTLLQTRLMLGAIALTSCILVPVSWMRMREHSALFLFVNVSWVGTQALMSAILLWRGYGVTGVMVACLVAHALAAFGLLLWMKHTTGISINFQQWRRFIVFGAPLILVGMAGFVLGSLDRWILADQVSTSHMAIYALAAKFGLATVMLIQPFDMWWLPKRFEVLRKTDGAQQSAKIISIGLTWAILSALGVAIIGPWIIEFLTPQSYHEAAKYVPWLAVLAAVHASSNYLNIGCQSGKSTGALAVIDGLAAAIAFAGYVYLIPKFGADGAIYATAIALTARLVATFVTSNSKVRIPIPLVKLSVVATLGVLSVLWLSQIGTEITRGLIGGGCIAIVAGTAILLKVVPLNSQRALN